MKRALHRMAGILLFSFVLTEPSHAVFVDPPPREVLDSVCTEYLESINLQAEGGETRTNSWRVRLEGGWGYSNFYSDRVIRAFARYAATAASPVLELAAGVGTPSIAALKAGARSVIANDIFRRHLNYVYLFTPSALRPRLTLDLGVFPTEIHIEPGSLSAVFVGRFLHFFDDATVIEYLQVIRAWLRPGGRIFIEEDSPFLGSDFEKVRREYERRAALGHPHPGEFRDPESFFPPRAGALRSAKLVVMRSKEEWAALLRAADFHVRKREVFYMNQKDMPDEMRYDGREGIGAIGRKSSQRRTTENARLGG